MSAEQRGELLAQVMAGAPAGAEVGKRTHQPSEGASRGSQSLEGVTLLKIAAVELPSRLKNKLRWARKRYAALEAMLRGTQHLRFDRSSGKAVWRTDDGRPLRKDIVLKLFEAGLLEE